ncbi:MAG: hypothetical protein AB8G11_18210 [Saprospiraceae bacterium]
MSVIKTVTIVFNPTSLPSKGQYISIGVQTNSGEGFLVETFDFIRIREGQVLIDGTASLNAFNFTESVNLDGNGLNVRAFQTGNTVELILTNDSYHFTTITGSLIDNGKVTVTTTNGVEVVEPSLELTNFTTDASNVCGNINAIIGAAGGNDIYEVYVNNVLSLSAQSSPITLNLNRGGNYSVRVVSDNSDIGVLGLKTPRKLIPNDINVKVFNYINGSTINIDTTYISEYTSPYTYSLNGTDYQESNIFSNLIAGDYTVYVKDNLGCSVSKSISINEDTTVTETIFDISELNSLRFSKYETTKKNHTNTLSCNEISLINHKHNHLFTPEDVVKTQFKTNAKYINVYTLDEDSNTNTLSAFKQTSNIGLEEKTTCTYFDIGDGRSAVYFGVVDKINPVNDAFIESVNYGFTLPEWANKEGNLVSIGSVGQIEVDSIGYSDLYESFILEFNVSYNGQPMQDTIYSKYNLQPYEVYEFDLTIANESDNLNVVIECGTSINNIDFTYISENVRKINDGKFLFDIDYWNDVNVGKMVYQTGIKHKLRLNGLVEYVGEQTTEGYDGDREYYVTDNSVYHSQKFSFFRVTNEVAHKLRLIFASSELYINNIKYKLSESPEISQGDGNSNFKNFFVTLKSSGNLILEDVSEQINDTAESSEINSLITAVQGKSAILWTK